MHDTFRAFYEGVQQMSHPIDARRLRLLDDGDTLPAGGRDWQVHVTPGHSVRHVSLYEPAERALLSGEPLPACLTPTPYPAPHPAPLTGRRRRPDHYLPSLHTFLHHDPPPDPPP